MVKIRFISGSATKNKSQEHPRKIGIVKMDNAVAIFFNVFFSAVLLPVLSMCDGSVGITTTINIDATTVVNKFTPFLKVPNFKATPRLTNSRRSIKASMYVETRFHMKMKLPRRKNTRGRRNEVNLRSSDPLGLYTSSIFLIRDNHIC